jgi:hypothetical protein
MAMIDYGCIVKKEVIRNYENDNREGWTLETEILKSKDLFYEDLAGFLGIKEEELTEDEQYVQGNSFHYIGDRRFMIAFYKTYMTFLKDGKEFLSDKKHSNLSDAIRRGDWRYIRKFLKEYNLDEFIDDILGGELDICNNRFNIVLYYKPDEKGDRWSHHAIFGYGIDYDYKNQLKIAGNYDLTKDEIEAISDFWEKPVYIKSVKVKKRPYGSGKRDIYFKYKYGKFKKEE